MSTGDNKNKTGDDQEIIWALQTGDLDVVKSYYPEDCDSTEVEVNRALKSGRMPLHHAADYGQTDVIEHLLSVNANVNAVDKYSITPLISACSEGHLKCVQLLLAKGADKSQKGPEDKLAIEFADSKEIQDLLK